MIEYVFIYVLKEVARLLEIFLHQGAPLILQSDNDREFAAGINFLNFNLAIVIFFL
jgi:hypothetical protein